MAFLEVVNVVRPVVVVVVMVAIDSIRTSPASLQSPDLGSKEKLRNHSSDQ